MEQDSLELMTMRYMCWERVKGELHAYMHTFWKDQEAYAATKPLIEQFIDAMDALN